MKKKVFWFVMTCNLERPQLLGRKYCFLSSDRRVSKPSKKTEEAGDMHLQNVGLSPKYMR
jgi:hypothetical protein